MATRDQFGFNFFSTPQNRPPTKIAEGAHASVMDIFAGMEMPPACDWHTRSYQGDVRHRYIRKHGPNGTFLDLEIGYVPIIGSNLSSLFIGLTWRSSVGENGLVLMCHEHSGNWEVRTMPCDNWRGTPNGVHAWQRRWLSATNNGQPPPRKRGVDHTVQMSYMISEFLDIYLRNNAPTV